jgi:hypothetical protein
MTSLPRRLTLLASFALLGSLVGSSAHAIPFSVNDRSTLLTAGSTSTEPSLADILPGAGYGGGFAASDQTTNALFSAFGSNPLAGLIIEHAGYRDGNELGIYNLAGETLTLFDGSDGGGDTTTMIFSGNDLTVGGTTLTDFGTSFGFYMRNDDVGFSWFSQDILNPGERAHFLGFEEDGALYFGFEDLDLGDHDYNDLVAKVTGLSGASGGGGGEFGNYPTGPPYIPPTSSPVPEPSAALVFGAGLLAMRIGLRGSHSQRQR